MTPQGDSGKCESTESRSPTKAKICVVGPVTTWSPVLLDIVYNAKLSADINSHVNVHVANQQSNTSFISKLFSFSNNIETNLPDNLHTSDNINQLANASDVLIFATPIEQIECITSSLENLKDTAFALTLTNGLIVNDKGQMSLVTEHIKKKLGIPCYTLTTNDNEGLLGCDNVDHQTLLARLLKKNNYRLNVTNDVAAAEICGTFKEILNISSGLCNGLYVNDETRCRLILQGLLEMFEFYKTFTIAQDVPPMFDDGRLFQLFNFLNSNIDMYAAQAMVETNRPIYHVENEMLNGRRLTGTISAENLANLFKYYSVENQYPLITTVHKICSNVVKAKELENTQVANLVIDVTSHIDNASIESSCPSVVEEKQGGSMMQSVAARSQIHPDKPSPQSTPTTSSADEQGAAGVSVSEKGGNMMGCNVLTSSVFSAANEIELTRKFSRRARGKKDGTGADNKPPAVTSSAETPAPVNAISSSETAATSESAASKMSNEVTGNAVPCESAACSVNVTAESNADVNNKSLEGLNSELNRVLSGNPKVLEKIQSFVEKCPADSKHKLLPALIDLVSDVYQDVPRNSNEIDQNSNSAACEDAVASLADDVNNVKVKRILEDAKFVILEKNKFKLSFNSNSEAQPGLEQDNEMKTGTSPVVGDPCKDSLESVGQLGADTSCDVGQSNETKAQSKLTVEGESSNDAKQTMETKGESDAQTLSGESQANETKAEANDSKKSAETTGGLNRVADIFKPSPKPKMTISSKSYINEVRELLLERKPMKYHKPRSSRNQKTPLDRQITIDNKNKRNKCTSSYLFGDVPFDSTELEKRKESKVEQGSLMKDEKSYISLDMEKLKKHNVSEPYDLLKNMGSKMSNEMLKQRMGLDKTYMKSYTTDVSKHNVDSGFLLKDAQLLALATRSASRKSSSDDKNKNNPFIKTKQLSSSEKSAQLAQIREIIEKTKALSEEVNAISACVNQHLARHMMKVAETARHKEAMQATNEKFLDKNSEKFRQHIDKLVKGNSMNVKNISKASGLYTCQSKFDETPRLLNPKNFEENVKSLAMDGDVYIIVCEKSEEKPKTICASTTPTTSPASGTFGPSAGAGISDFLKLSALKESEICNKIDTGAQDGGEKTAEAFETSCSSSKATEKGNPKGTTILSGKDLSDSEKNKAFELKVKETLENRLKATAESMKAQGDEAPEDCEDPETSKPRSLKTTETKADASSDKDTIKEALKAKFPFGNENQPYNIYDALLYSKNKDAIAEGGLKETMSLKKSQQALRRLAKAITEGMPLGKSSPGKETSSKENAATDEDSAQMDTSSEPLEVDNEPSKLSNEEKLAALLRKHDALLAKIAAREEVLSEIKDKYKVLGIEPQEDDELTQDKNELEAKSENEPQSKEMKAEKKAVPPVSSQQIKSQAANKINYQKPTREAYIKPSKELKAAPTKKVAQSDNSGLSTTQVNSFTGELMKISKKPKSETSKTVMKKLKLKDCCKPNPNIDLKYPKYMHTDHFSSVPKPKMAGSGVVGCSSSMGQQFDSTHIIKAPRATKSCSSKPVMLSKAAGMAIQVIKYLRK